MGQTVNLLSYDFEGSNPSLPTNAFWQGTGIGKPHLAAGQKNQAEVAHLVEHQPCKLRVAGSSPVFRSKKIPLLLGRDFFMAAPVVELVDTQDLKSCSPQRE